MRSADRISDAAARSLYSFLRPPRKVLLAPSGHRPTGSLCTAAIRSSVFAVNFAVWPLTHLRLRALGNTESKV